ncbi:MAG: hypothetical protein H7Y04_05980 [Verrucomicrobia bacterium]|nr:hypothetical protein [Cytophagales bacterium]
MQTNFYDPPYSPIIWFILVGDITLLSESPNFFKKNQLIFTCVFQNLKRDFIVFGTFASGYCKLNLKGIKILADAYALSSMKTGFSQAKSANFGADLA